MAQSQEHKAQTHERILAQASEQLRRDGVSAISIAQLMTSAGLTHGGFYRHFDSRDDLIAQATARALKDGAAAGVRARAVQPSSLSTYVKGYLSRSHRDSPGNGCAIAALAGDVPRAGAATSTVFTEGLKSALQRLAGQHRATEVQPLTGEHEDRAEADLNVLAQGAAPRASIKERRSNADAEEKNMKETIHLLSTLVGALTLARAVDDAALSDLILSANRQMLLESLKATP